MSYPSEVTFFPRFGDVLNFYIFPIQFLIYLKLLVVVVKSTSKSIIVSRQYCFKYTHRKLEFTLIVWFYANFSSYLHLNRRGALCFVFQNKRYYLSKVLERREKNMLAGTEFIFRMHMYSDSYETRSTSNQYFLPFCYTSLLENVHK